MSGLLISDAAKEVQVESHVLRYWEEELQLPIQRNELGHRYYTDEDVERFKKIKSMKESGLQLKAIKMILRDGRFDVLPQEESPAIMIKAAENADAERRAVNREEVNREAGNGQVVAGGRTKLTEEPTETREEKAQRLQWIMQQLIRQAVQENNIEIVQQIRESVLKELDYQFRMQEEREEERDRKAVERAEQHYQQVDELLRKKTGRKKVMSLNGNKEKGSEKAANQAETQSKDKSKEGKKEKKKKGFLF